MGSILDLNCGLVALLLAHVEAKLEPLVSKFGAYRPTCKLDTSLDQSYQQTQDQVFGILLKNCKIESAKVG